MTTARYRCSSLLMAKDQFTSRIPLLPTTTTITLLKNIHDDTSNKCLCLVPFKSCLWEAKIPARSFSGLAYDITTTDGRRHFWNIRPTPIKISCRDICPLKRTVNPAILRIAGVICDDTWNKCVRILAEKKTDKRTDGQTRQHRRVKPLSRWLKKLWGYV